MVMVMPGVIVTVAEPDWVESATLVAVMVTVFGDGAVGGAVYKPALVIIPTVLFPPATPLTLQVTWVFDVPVTVAVNCC